MGWQTERGGQRGKAVLGVIGQHLADLRKRRKWSQADLADHCGVNVKTILSAEKGGTDIGILLLLEIMWQLDVSQDEVIALLASDARVREAA